MKNDANGNVVPTSESKFKPTDLKAILKTFKKWIIYVVYVMELNSIGFLLACLTKKYRINLSSMKGQVKLREIKLIFWCINMKCSKRNKTIYQWNVYTLHLDSKWLSSLGKTYSNVEKLRKISRCLLQSKLGPKITAIEEVQDLWTLLLDDLLKNSPTRDWLFMMMAKVMSFHPWWMLL